MKSRKPRTKTRKPESVAAPEPAPAPATVPAVPPKAFSIRQWKESPVLQKALRELLENPIFKMGQQTVMMMAMPNAQPVTQLLPGISAEAMALADSQRYHHRSGMAQAFRALENLARAQGAEASTVAQWGKLQLEDE